MLKLRSAWEGWKRIARVIGNLQARLILSVLYVLLIAPVGLVVRALGDPLGQKRARAERDSLWSEREEAAASEQMDEARRQF